MRVDSLESSLSEQKQSSSSINDKNYSLFTAIQSQQQQHDSIIQQSQLKCNEVNRLLERKIHEDSVSAKRAVSDSSVTNRVSNTILQPTPQHTQKQTHRQRAPSKCPPLSTQPPSTTLLRQEIASLSVKVGAMHALFLPFDDEKEIPSSQRTMTNWLELRFGHQQLAELEISAQTHEQQVNALCAYLSLDPYNMRFDKLLLSDKFDLFDHKLERIRKLYHLMPLDSD